MYLFNSIFLYSINLYILVEQPMRWNLSWMKQFFGNYRHYNTSLFITGQQLRSSVPTHVRNQCTLAILYPTTDQQELTALHKSFGGVVGDERRFIAEFKTAT